MRPTPEITISECVTVDELSACVDLQREVFALPDIEISPVRHLIVTKHAGGFTLGAFSGGELVGFVLSVPAVLRGQKAFYSHMTAVRHSFQGFGIGAMLKWAQRERALEEGVRFVKWTFQPVLARNAFFNLEKLGAIVRHYEPNFYGTDYLPVETAGKKIGLDSDRLFAEWDLESEKVRTLAAAEKYVESRVPAASIEMPNDWSELVKSDPQRAVAEQERVKCEFQKAFAEGLSAESFERSDSNPRYLLFKS